LHPNYYLKHKIQEIKICIENLVKEGETRLKNLETTIKNKLNLPQSFELSYFIEMHCQNLSLVENGNKVKKTILESPSAYDLQNIKFINSLLGDSEDESDHSS